MARVIYIVNATQVVTSDTHPEGIYSNISNYPKTFDSRQYDGDTEKALRLAKAEYLSRLSALLASDAAQRVMATVTLERSDGRMIMHESMGAFPAEPEPEVEPEEVTGE